MVSVLINPPTDDIANKDSNITNEDESNSRSSKSKSNGFKSRFARLSLVKKKIATLPRKMIPKTNHADDDSDSSSGPPELPPKTTSTENIDSTKPLEKLTVPDTIQNDPIDPIELLDDNLEVQGKKHKSKKSLLSWSRSSKSSKNSGPEQESSSSTSSNNNAGTDTVQNLLDTAQNQDESQSLSDVATKDTTEEMQKSVPQINQNNETRGTSSKYKSPQNMYDETNSTNRQSYQLNHNGHVYDGAKRQSNYSRASSARHSRMTQNTSERPYHHRENSNVSFQTGFEPGESKRKNLANYSTSTLKRSQRIKLLGKQAAFYWDTPKVSSWLDQLGLAEYIDTFQQNGVNGQVLLELQREQLVGGLHVTNEYHLLSLERGILELRKRHIVYDKWDWGMMGVQLWLEQRGFEVLMKRFRDCAIHGGVLFNLNREEIARLVTEATNSPNPSDEPLSPINQIIVESLALSIERARDYGRDSDNGIPDWGASDVYEWLQEQHLGHLNQIFRSHCVSGPMLLQLTKEDMHDRMQLTEIQSIVLEKAIKLLRKTHMKNLGMVKRISSAILPQSNSSKQRYAGYVQRYEDDDDPFYEDDEIDEN